MAKRYHDTIVAETVFFACTLTIPVLGLSGRQHYRLYTIHRIPTLKTLDFTKVKNSEREKARRLANSAAGAALEGDIQQEARTATKTFVPGESLDDAKAVVISFTAEEKEQIRNLLANASSAKELEEIETSVKSGVLPEALRGNKRKRENGHDS
jgi:U2 small nuclear ribonucleoprotein A'